MRRLNRYLGKTVLASTLGTLLVLVSLIIIATLVDEMGEMEGDYDFVTILSYVGLLIPRMIYEYLSYATFLGCIIGLGVHANANELVVLRAAGVSMVRMVWAVMRPVLLMIVVGVLWGEYITPVSAELAENIRSAALTTEDDETRSGLWHREGNEFAYFESVQSNGRLYGITRYQFDESGQLLSSLSAEQAIYQNDYWLLENGTISNFNSGSADSSDSPSADSNLASRSTDRRAKQESFIQRAWYTDLSPDQLKLLVLEPETLSIQNLYRYAQSRDRQGLDSNDYWLSFWQKIMQPLIILGLVLVGISFVFGSLREASMGFRVTLAVLVGIIFEMSQNLLGTSSLALGFPPVLAVLHPALLPIIVGTWLLKRS